MVDPVIHGMSPVTTLFLVLVGIYLLECVILVPDEALVLVEAGVGRWKVVRASIRLGALRKRAVLAGVLSPARIAVMLPPWPLAMSPEGIAWLDVDGVLCWRPYSALATLEVEGSVVRLTDGAVLLAHTVPGARHLAAVLTSLYDAREDARASLIEAELSRAMSLEVPRARLTEYHAASARLRVVSTVLFAHLFIGWPAVIAWSGVTKLWPYVVAELVVLVALTTWQFVRAHRALFADVPLDVAALVGIILSPAAALRATTLLARGLFATSHPVAVAGALCSGEDFTALTSRLTRDLEFRTAHGPSSAEARAVEAWFTARHRAALASLASRVLDGRPFPRAPERESDRSRAYCPRCWMQYSTTDSTCIDCGGLPLRSFS